MHLHIFLPVFLLLTMYVGSSYLFTPKASSLFHPKFLNTQALLFSHFAVGPQTFCGREAFVVPTVNEGIPWNCEKISESAKEEEQKQKQLLVSEHNQKTDREGPQ